MKKNNFLAKFYNLNFNNYPNSWCLFVWGLFWAVITSPTFLLPKKWFKFILNGSVKDDRRDDKDYNPPYEKRFLLLIYTILLLIVEWKLYCFVSQSAFKIITIKAIVIINAMAMALWDLIFNDLKICVKILDFIIDIYEKYCPKITWKD